MIKYQIVGNSFLPVFSRGHQVMLAILDANNNLYLARKNAYPPGIYRLFGGGVEPNEVALEAAKRELYEETGLKLTPNHLETFDFQLTHLSSQQTWTYTSDLYSIQLEHQTITVADDVDDYKSFSKSELNSLLSLYQKLENDWQTWGQIFGLITQRVFS